jgi:hypothetical protein
VTKPAHVPDSRGSVAGCPGGPNHQTIVDQQAWVLFQGWRATDTEERVTSASRP